MTVVLRWWRSLPPIALLGAGWVAFLVYAYPGYLSPDSLSALGDARTGTMHDAQSPLFAATWHVMEYVLAGPPGLLLAQSALFLWGLYVLLARAMSPRRAAIAASCTLCFPPIGTTLAVLWPDGLMAAMLVAGVAAAGGARRSVRLAGLALLAIGGGLRAGAWLATVPLVALAWRWGDYKRVRNRVAVAIVACAAVVAVPAILTSALTDEPTYPWSTTVAPYDVAGTLAHAGPIDASELDNALTGTPLRAGLSSDRIQDAARAACRGGWWFSVVHGDDRLFDPPDGEVQRDAITSAWRTLVVGYPMAYLEHRSHLFAAQLGLARSPSFLPVYTELVPAGVSRADVAHDAEPSPIQRLETRIAGWLGKTPLFLPILYLLLAFTMIPVAIRVRGADAVAVLASGVVYELTLFFVAASAEYRFSHWMITSAVIGAVLALAARARSPGSGSMTMPRGSASTA